MNTAVTRRATFNAAHRLHNPSKSDEWNASIFGKCNYPNYHGHNYVLYVTVSGPINPDTGYVIDMKVLADLIKEKVENRFDHKNLNLDTIEFKNIIPTAENIARVIHGLLRAEIEPHLSIKIKLYETERNIVEYPA
jgi:6-pyruvoyltetrahydropterin/6-carboxytetrahydropterin synthase